MLDLNIGLNVIGETTVRVYSVNTNNMSEGEQQPEQAHLGQKADNSRIMSTESPDASRNPEASLNLQIK